jgi:hypothetical protein
MDFKFPFNQDVENAQENILQARSAQEIKDLLKSDDPQKPIYQEGLTRLVTQHIMNKIPLEEIDRIENIPHRNVNAKYGEPPFSRARTGEIVKLASKMDNELITSIVTSASQKHDPYMIPKEQRDSTEPQKDVGLSVAYAVVDHIKKYPNAVEKIFDDVLPKIQQEKTFDNQNKIEIARKAGYIQGVSECVLALGDDYTLGKKLLTEMNVTKDLARKYANPETYKTLEQGIFASKQEQNLEQTQGIKR